MTTIRLSKWMIEELEKKLVRHAFSAEVVHLVERQMALADRVYLDIFTPSVRARMGDLPEGWLPVVSSITVKFGEGGQQVQSLLFNGRQGLIHGDLSVGLDSSALVEAPPRRVPHSKKDGVLKVYDLTDPLARAWEDISTTRGDLAKKIADARRQAKATAQQFSSVQGLIKAWPEVEPFCSRWLVAASVPVPAIRRDVLNGMLGLPVSSSAPAAPSKAH